MDQQLFLWVNGFAGKFSWLDFFGKFFGGDLFLYAVLLAVGLIWLAKQYRKNVYLAINSAIISRAIVTEFLKVVINRPRPYEALQVQKLIVDLEHGVSFPSGHATIYFALAFAFWNTKYFWPFLILACLGSVARVFVGVHYPADVVAGAVIGAVTALVLKRYLFKHT